MDKIDVCFLGNWYIGAEILKEIIKCNRLRVKTVISTVKETDEFSHLVKFVAEHENIEFYNTVTSDWKHVLRNNKFDLIVSVSFNYLLSYDLFKSCEYGAINLHQSILPKYRGRDPIANAIINGDEKIGFTIHYIDEGMDTGNIIFQSIWPLSLNDKLETINFKMVTFAKKVICDVIKLIILKDKSKGFVQSGEYSLAPKIDISWSETVLEIRNKYGKK